MTATVNGVRLSYSDIGHGIPIDCLHGGMGVDAASLHVPGILDLAQLGIRLIVPDQRGHGESERISQSDLLAQGVGRRRPRSCRELGTAEIRSPCSVIDWQIDS